MLVIGSWLEQVGIPPESKIHQFNPRAQILACVGLDSGFRICDDLLYRSLTSFPSQFQSFGFWFYFASAFCILGVCRIHRNIHLTRRLGSGGLSEYAHMDAVSMILFN